jgi:hypothetical protein
LEAYGMSHLPFEIVDDQRQRVADHGSTVLILVAVILLAAATAWWVDPIALIADEDYLNPFSLMLALAIAAILWQSGRAGWLMHRRRRAGSLGPDGQAGLYAASGRATHRAGHPGARRASGAGRRMASGRTRLRGHLCVAQVSGPQRYPRRIPIEAARTTQTKISPIGTGQIEFTITLPDGLKPLAIGLARGDGQATAGAGFQTIPFTKPRLAGGANVRPSWRHWRLEVLHHQCLAAFDLSEHVESGSERA